MTPNKLTITFTQTIPESYLPAEPHMDLLSLIPFTITAQNYAVIPTGLRAEIPDGYILIITSRRTLAEVHQVIVMNAPAIIHPQSPAEIKVILENRSVVPYTVKEGEPIAQMTLIQIVPFMPIFPADK